MVFLVDYYNIDALIAGRGLLYIAERALTALHGAGIPLPQRAEFRLYGGWFSESRLSKGAQTLAADIANNFPSTLAFPVADRDPIKVVVNCELNQSLAATTNQPLTHTVRTRPFTDKLTFRWPTGRRCVPTSCRMLGVSEFVQSVKCPASDCSHVQSDFLHHTAQKMVDTMLVSDLIYWAYRPNSPQIVVVSSDDDIWPGIRTAIAIKQPIIQLHTKRSPLHSQYMGRMGKTSYIEIPL